ncbi:hypothetical protein [Streptomyces sp. NPDC094472]
MRGDQFRRMVVNGRAQMSAARSDEALGRLRPHPQLTAQVI